MAQIWRGFHNLSVNGVQGWIRPDSLVPEKDRPRASLGKLSTVFVLVDTQGGHAHVSLAVVLVELRTDAPIVSIWWVQDSGQRVKSSGGGGQTFTNASPVPAVSEGAKQIFWG